MSKLEKHSTTFMYTSLPEKLIQYLFKKPYVTGIIERPTRVEINVTFKHIELAAEEKYNESNWTGKAVVHSKGRELYLSGYKQMQKRLDRAIFCWHPNFFIRSFKNLIALAQAGQYNPIPMFKHWRRRVRDQQYRVKLHQATTGLFLGPHIPEPQRTHDG